MNKVFFTGHLCRNIELKKLASGSIKTDFTLAIKGRNNDYFIDCEAWGKTAELLNAHFRNGDKLGFVGRVATDEYTDKNGVKRYKTYFVVEEIEFMQTRKAEETAAVVSTSGMVETDDTELPF